MTAQPARLLMLLIIIALVALTGCRRGGAVQESARPTATATPRSTPLPPIATPVPAGVQGNPVRVLLIGASGRAQALIDSAAADLEPALTTASGLTVAVTVVGEDAEIVAALCASTPTEIAVGWMSGAAYAAANASGCGRAALQIARGSGDTAETGAEGALIANRDARIENAADVAGKTLCRLESSDVYSHLIPAVLLNNGGAEEAIIPNEIVLYPDLNAMTEALQSGECDAAGMSDLDYQGVANADLTVVARSTAIPFAVLVIPEFLPAAQRAALVDAFLTIGNGAQSDTLRPILGHDEIVTAEDSDFARLRAFFSQAGVDLAALGS